MKKILFLIPFFFISFHLYLMSQLSFTVWPEMLVMPYLMDHGFELYRDMFVPWTPGLMWALAGWFDLLGLSAESLKLFTWLLIIGIDFLVFCIAKKRWGNTSAYVALVTYILLQPVFDGNGLWFDFATTPLLLLSFYFNSPFILSLAFLIKQSVVWLCVLFLKQWKKLMSRIGIVLVISAAWFWFRGTLLDYLFWAYDYTFRVFPTMPGHADFGSWRLWIFALSPFLVLFGYRFSTSKSARWMLDPSDPLSWALLSIPFSLPRFGLFHFQPALAFFSLAAGEMYKNYKDYKYYKIFALIGVIYLAFVWRRTLFFQWQRPDRFLESDVYQLAAKVSLETKKEEPVLLVNAPELVYVLANRFPPKPWFTQFPWFLELPGFQEQVILQFKQQNLQQVFFTPYLNEGEYAPGSYQPKQLLEYMRTISNDSND